MKRTCNYILGLHVMVKKSTGYILFLVLFPNNFVEPVTPSLSSIHASTWFLLMFTLLLKTK